MGDFWFIPTSNSRNEHIQQSEGEQFFSGGKRSAHFFSKSNGVAGNHIQAKNASGQPGGSFKKEADEMADNGIENTPPIFTGKHIPLSASANRVTSGSPGPAGTAEGVVQRDLIVIGEVKRKRDTVAIDHSPPWDIWDDLQWHYNIGFFDPYKFRMVLHVTEEKRKKLRPEDIAANAVLFLQSGMGVKFRESGFGLMKKIKVMIEEYELDGNIFSVGIEPSEIKEACEDPNAYDKYFETLQANKFNHTQDYLIASGNFGSGASGKGSNKVGSQGTQKGSTKELGNAWADKQKVELEKIIKQARESGKDAGKLPDAIALWQKKETGDWYINVWVKYDKQGKKKSAHSIRLQPDEKPHELLERIKGAAAQAATHEADRELAAQSKTAPDWAIEITKKLKNYFDGQRKTKAPDIPDGLELAMNKAQASPDDPALSIQIWVERGNVKKQRNRGSVPLVVGAKVENLISYIRHMTTVLRQYENEPLTDDPARDPKNQMLPDPSKLGLPPFPAQLIAKDMREDHISVTGGTNVFLMNLDFEAVYGNAGSVNDLYIASKLYNQYIHYYWSIYKVPDDLKPESSAPDAAKDAQTGANEPAPAQSWPKRWAWLYDLYNKGKDKPEEKVKQVEKLNSPVSKTNGSDIKRSLKLPPNPGVYILQCVTASAPVGDYELKRSPSYAFFPFMTMPIAKMGEESVSQRGTAIDQANAEIKSIEELLAGGGLNESQTALLKERQLWKAQELERLKLKETQTAAQNAASEISYANKLIGQLKELEAVLPGYIEKAKADGVKPSDLLKAKPELLGLYWHLMSEGKSVIDYRKELEAQLVELTGFQKRSAEFGSEFDPSSPYQYMPEAAFVSEVTGHIYPLVLMVGQSPTPKGAKFGPPMVSYTVADITSSQTQEAYTGYSTDSGPSAHRKAIDHAFDKFGDDATYGEGIIAVRFSGGDARKADQKFPGSNIIKYPSEEGLFEKVMWALGIIGAIAGAAALMATGIGAGAAAGLLGALAATAGAATAIHNISERSKKHKLEWDAEMAMDIIGIISVVPLAAGARLATLPKTASNFRSIAVAGRFLQIYGYSEAGLTMVLIPLKLAQDIQRIENDTTLKPEQKRKMIKEAKLGALQGGLMMLGGAVASHAAGSRARQGNVNQDPASFDQQVKLMELEGFGEYNTMQNRGLVDENGNWTAKARYIFDPTPPAEPGVTKPPVDTPAEPVTVPGKSTPEQKIPAQPPPKKSPPEPSPIEEPKKPRDTDEKVPPAPTAPAKSDDGPSPVKNKQAEDADPPKPKPPTESDKTPVTKPVDPVVETPAMRQESKIKEAEAKVQKRRQDLAEFQAHAKEAGDQLKVAKEEKASAKGNAKKEANKKLAEAKANKKAADEMLEMAEQDLNVAKSEASQQRQIKLATEAEATRKVEDPVREDLNKKHQQEKDLHQQYQKKAKKRDELIREIDGMVGSKMDDAALQKFRDKNAELQKVKGQIDNLSQHLDKVRGEIGAKSRDLAELQKLTLGRIEKLQAEIREGRGITKEHYEKLRAQTPSDTIREKYRKSKMDSVYPKHEIVGTPEPDHIVSMHEITQMEGFNRLTEKQQVEVLNTPENFMPLDKRVNGSKGDRSFSQWDGHPEFGEIDPKHKQFLMDKETVAREAVRKAIEARDPLQKNNPK